MNSITLKAINEVYSSHVLIQNWFNGAEEITLEDLNQLLTRFSSDFLMVTPNGAELKHKELSSYLLGMYGARPDVKIEITKPLVIIEGDEYCILRYEEIQHMEQKTLHRISTAVFICDGKDGVLWRHLHETWVLAS